MRSDSEQIRSLPAGSERVAPGSRRYAPARSALFAGFIAAAIGLSNLLSSPASAACVPDSGTAIGGDTVLCSDTTPGGFIAGPGVENLSILVEAGATVNNAAAGGAAIEINANNPTVDTVAGVDMQGLLELTGDGSAGIRGAEPNDDAEFNSTIVSGLITDTDTDAQATGGDDVIGVDFGDHGIVVHEGQIILNGDRNIAIRVGDDAEVQNNGLGDSDDGNIQIRGDDSTGILAGDRSSVFITASDVEYDLEGDRSTAIEVGDDGFVRYDGSLLIVRGLDARGLVVGDSTGGAGAASGIDIDGRVAVVGENGRAVLAGDGWNGDMTGLIRVRENGTVRASGLGGVSIEAGNDARIEVEGVVFGGFTSVPGGTGILVGDQTTDTALILVTGEVLAQGDDSAGISTGSKTLDPGIDLDAAPAPSVQIGTLGDGGTVRGDPGSNALITLRTGTAASDYNYVLITPDSDVTANETQFVDPTRAIAVQGADGAERIENYGQIQGKVLLEGGDDLFIMGTTGTLVGSQFIDGGAGTDTFELSNRFSIQPNDPESVFDFSSVWNFEELVVNDTTPWRATGTSAANAFEDVEITPGSSFSVENPLLFSAGADRFSNAGGFDGEAQLGGGADTYQSFSTGSLSATAVIDGGAGNDTLDLGDDGSANVGTFQFGSRVTGFESVLVRSGSSWQLDGDAAATNPGIDMQIEDGAELRLNDSLVMDGDVDFSPGSSLYVSVNRNTTGAYLGTSGAITIEEDAPDLLTSTLVIEPLGSLDDGSILILSGASLTGEFEDLSLPTGGAYDFTTRYDAAAGTLSLDVVRLSIAPNRDATDTYLRAVNSAGPNPALQAFLDELNALDSDTYIETLDQLHPETYDAQTSIQLSLARAYQQIMLERPDHCIAPEGSGRRHERTRTPCRPRPFDVWTTGYGFGGKRTGEVGHVSWKGNGGGAVLGTDHRSGDDLLFSGSIGGARNVSRVDGIGKGRFTTLDLGALVAWTPGSLRLQGFGTYGHGWHQAYRNIAFGAIARTAEGNYNRNRYALGGQVAWTFALSGLDVAPVFDIDWALISREDFAETGAAPVNLFVQGVSNSVTTVRVGVELGTSLLKKGYWTDFLEKTDGLWEPELAVRWRQVVQGDRRGLDSAIIGEPGGVGAFGVNGNDANMGFEIGAGLNFTPKGATRVTLGVRYEGFVWQNVNSHEVSGTVRYSF